MLIVLFCFYTLLKEFNYLTDSISVINLVKKGKNRALQGREIVLFILPFHVISYEYNTKEAKITFLMKNGLFILIVVNSIAKQQKGKYIRILPCITFASLENIFFLIHFSFCSLHKEKASSICAFVNIKSCFSRAQRLLQLPDVRLKAVFSKEEIDEHCEFTSMCNKHLSKGKKKK